MDFTELLDAARAGDTVASEHLLKLYRPLLVKESTVNGVFDQDLYNELCAELVSATQQFRKPDV